MKEERVEIIEGLRKRLGAMMAIVEDLRHENASLKEKEKEYDAKLKDKEQELEFLKNKYNKLKLAKGILSASDDKHDAKIKINRIVREIDKSIALLNR